MFIQPKKKLTPQNVFDYLRKIYGQKEAIDLMDSVEGHPQEYQKLVTIVESGELEKDLLGNNSKPS